MLVAAITGGLAALIWGIRRGSAGGNDPESGSMPQQGGLQAPREEAVLVFGSTGKLGRQIVAKVSSAVDNLNLAQCESIHKAIKQCALTNERSSRYFSAHFMPPQCPTACYLSWHKSALLGLKSRSGSCQDELASLQAPLRSSSGAVAGSWEDGGGGCAGHSEGGRGLRGARLPAGLPG